MFIGFYKWWNNFLRMHWIGALAWIELEFWNSRYATWGISKAGGGYPKCQKLSEDIPPCLCFSHVFSVRPSLPKLTPRAHHPVLPYRNLCNCTLLLPCLKMPQAVLSSLSCPLLCSTCLKSSCHNLWRLLLKIRIIFVKECQTHHRTRSAIMAALAKQK